MAIPIAFEGSGTSGPPLLLVHGFPLDRTQWRAQLPALGANARVVAIDLPGFGGSLATGDGRVPTTMDAYGDAVLDLADGLGWSRFVLAGLSMGGYVALSILRRRPERLAGLALCDTRVEPDTPEQSAGRLTEAERVLEEGPAALFEQSLGRLLAPSPPPSVVAAVREMMSRASPAGIASALRGMAERPDGRGSLGRLRVPTLVLVGARDVVTPPAGAHAMAAAIPGAELVVVPDAGHLAPLEQPEPVNDALRWLLGKVA